MNSIESLAFVFPLRADKTQEWRAWIREILGPRRSEYEAFSRKLGLKTQRAYLQLQTSQDPFAVWGRQRIQDLFPHEGGHRLARDSFQRQSEDDVIGVCVVPVRSRREVVVAFRCHLIAERRVLAGDDDAVERVAGARNDVAGRRVDRPSADEDEAHSHARKVMERLGMIRP